MYRVSSPSATLVSGLYNTNGNDGDANFRHGIVTNLFEILLVLDIKNNDFGMHFSGDYFVNTVYLQHNQSGMRYHAPALDIFGDQFHVFRLNLAIQSKHILI